MDTVTHGLAGLLLGRAAARDNSRSASIVCGLSAMFPDADAFFIPGGLGSPGSTLVYLEFHRGPTHSFLLAPIFAAAIAGVAKLINRRLRYQTLWLLALAGIASHILFDWITSYGTMFFSPLSWTRFALDWVFILDPIFTGILVLFLLLSLWRRRVVGRWIAAAGSALLFLYIGFCAAMHGCALAAARKIFSGAPVAALPQPFSPLRWALFADRGDEIDVAYVHLGAAGGRLHRWASTVPRTSLGGVLSSLRESYSPPATAAIERFPANERDPAVAAARGFPDSAVWFRFARFPVASVQPLGARGTRLILTDLRFRGPWGRPAFQFEVIVSPQGGELASGFVRLFTTSTAAKPR